MNENIEIKFINYIQNILGNNTELISEIMRFVSSLFHFKLYTLIVLVLYFLNKITTEQVFLICSSQLVIFSIKYFVNRKRPYVESSKVQLMETMYIDPYSFPSGHTFNAFILSYILKNNLGYGLNILPYFVGLSRMFLGVHYPSDVVGGILLAKIMLHIHTL